jgi:mRNA-degrading endonuclease RelE of RelBE toxin-antitoxin system
MPKPKPTPTLYGYAFSDAALRFLEGKTCPKNVREQIIKKVKALVTDPHPSGATQVKAVTDGGRPVNRVRSGDYRILYSIRDGPQVFVVTINHRKDVYRRKGRK